MTPQTPQHDALANDPGFRKLRVMRAKMSLRYSLFILAIFMAFIVTVFGFPDVVAGRLPEGSVLSLAVALAFLLMLLPALAAWLYLRRMDRDVEPLRARLAERRRP